MTQISELVETTTIADADEILLKKVGGEDFRLSGSNLVSSRESATLDLFNGTSTDTIVTPNALDERIAMGVAGSNLISDPSINNVITDGAEDTLSPTPFAYSAGYEFARNWFADDSTGATLSKDATTGVITLGAGSYYTLVPNTGTLKQSTDDVVVSVAGLDGTPSTSGASTSIVGDNYKVVVTASSVFSVKMEQGTRASLHEVDYIEKKNILDVIARSLNVTASEVIYSIDTATELDDILYIYDAAAEIIYAKPSTVGAGENIVSTSGDQLTTTITTYTMVRVHHSDKKTFESVEALQSADPSLLYAGQLVSTGATDWKILSTSGEISLGGGLFAKYMNGLHVIDYDGAAPDASLDGTTGTDNAAQINAALILSSLGGSVVFAAGNWGISSHIEERTNGGRRLLKGSGQKNTSIIALVGFTSVARGYMAWFGTQTGHGSYAFRSRDLTFDANNIAVGCLFVGENGQGAISDCDFRDFTEIGYRTNSATDAKIERCEFYSSVDDCWGIVATGANSAATQDPSGYSFSYTAGATSPSNEMKIRDCWFSGLGHAIWGNGDLFQIVGCTSQSCGQVTTRDDIIVISSQAFDADDVVMNFPNSGPVIQWNWLEGGFWRYGIRVSNYPAGLIEKNYVIGSSAAVNTIKEGGILVEAKRTVVRNNDFFQFFTATPSEGRLDNAAVYTVTDAFGSKVYDNAYQLTQDGNHGYEEGTADPTGDKSGFSEIFGVVEWSDPTTPIFTSNSNSISSVAHIATGIFQVNFKYNVQSENVPVLVSVGDSGSFTPAFVNYRWNGLGSIRISVADQAGASYVPDKVSFMVFAQSSTATL